MNVICQSLVSVEVLDSGSLPVHIASYKILSLCPQSIPEVETVVHETAVVELGLQ